MMIELTAADGHTITAYRAEPTSAAKGAVVVVQEIYGLNAHIKKVADAFAAEGYLAIAPAIFDRAKKDVALGYDEASLAEGTALANQIGVDSPLTDIQAAVNEAKSAGKVAIVGYGWGGYLAYLAANYVTGAACAICYYGGGIVDNYGGKRRLPTLLHFGETDPMIPAEQVTQFRALRPDVSVFTYAAGEGFNCDERPSYDSAAAGKAQERTLFWISQFVEGQGPVAMKNSGAYAQAKVEKKKKKGGDDLGPPMD